MVCLDGECFVWMGKWFIWMGECFFLKGMSGSAGRASSLSRCAS